MEQPYLFGDSRDWEKSAHELYCEICERIMERLMAFPGDFLVLEAMREVSDIVESNFPGIQHPWDEPGECPF